MTVTYNCWCLSLLSHGVFLIYTALLLYSLSFLFIFMVWSLHVSRHVPCNLHRVFHRGMVNDIKQIRKSCNLRHVFHRSKVDDTK